MRGGLRIAAIGAGLGVLWGAVLRAWMRYISTNPEFSWSGTLFILGASAIAGSVLGLARHRRSVGGVGWWRLSVASLLLLGAGGAVMWPTVVLGAIAIGRRRPRWVVTVLTLGAVAAQIPVMQDAVLENGRLGIAGKGVAILWFAPMIAAEAWAFSIAFAPSLAGVAVPGRLKRVLIVAPVALVAIFSIVVVGVPM